MGFVAGAKTVTSQPTLICTVGQAGVLVQNTGDANIRVGPEGVTPTTGYRLVPNQTIVYGQPNVNQGAIWAIREGATDSIAFSQEEVVAWPSAGPPVVPCPSCRHKDCECD